MCEICKNLIDVPADKKTSVTLKDVFSIDASRHDIHMVLDHEPDGTPKAFIHSEVDIISTGRCYGSSFDINYCPFCGEKLIK